MDDEVIELDQTPQGDGDQEKSVHGRQPDAGGGMGPELDRLPPPAFPPGSRRGVVHRPRSATDEADGSEVEGSVPEEAFISPDEPVRRIGDEFPDEAFISPDEPIRHREPRPADFADRGEHSGDGDDDEVVVTGIGGTQVRYPTDDPPAAFDTARLHDVSTLLEELAEAVRDRGAAALLTDHRTPPFEAMLRGLIAGYLVGDDDRG